MSTPQLRLNPADPRFADAVMADIGRLRATAAGRALFRRLLEAGSSVTIDKPQPPTRPPNAWTQLMNPEQRRGDTAILYDPADWPPSADQPSDVVLFGRLLDAVALATGTPLPDPFDGDTPAEIEAYLRERNAKRAERTSIEP